MNIEVRPSICSYFCRQALSRREIFDAVILILYGSSIIYENNIFVSITRTEEPFGVETRYQPDFAPGLHLFDIMVGYMTVVDIEKLLIENGFKEKIIFFRRVNVPENLVDRMKGNIRRHVFHPPGDHFPRSGNHFQQANILAAGQGLSDTAFDVGEIAQKQEDHDPVEDNQYPQAFLSFFSTVKWLVQRRSSMRLSDCLHGP
jgi:hypothetical protein